MHWIFLITIYLTKSRGLVRSSFTMLAAPIMDRTHRISLSEVSLLLSWKIETGVKSKVRGDYITKMM